MNLMDLATMFNQPHTARMESDTASATTGWRRYLTLALSVTAVTAAVLLPSRVPPAPAHQSNGTLRLRDVWPSAQIHTIPATLSDGSSYRPALILDPSTSIGLSTVDTGDSAVVIQRSDAPERTLRTVDAGSTVAAWADAGNVIVWAEVGADAYGDVTSIWRGFATSSTAPVQIVRERAELRYANSQYDLQIVGDQVYWATVGPHQDSEIHSAGISGGPIHTRRLDAGYQLTAWPWVITTGADAVGAGYTRSGDVDLLNVQTGERRRVEATTEERVRCTPIWCLVTTSVAGGAAETYAMEHPDGSGRRKLGSGALTPLDLDVALTDRFEVLGIDRAGQPPALAGRPAHRSLRPARRSDDRRRRRPG